ncbi:MAG: glycine zipper 2TM domain-containing protein [Rhodospirillales bacterium]|nr:glycine zipper 2TM domain-containing protein [Rhodospirillales bacterium]
MKRITLALLAALSVAVAGCAPSPYYHQQGGTLLGAAGGAALGARFGQGSGKLAATALGTLLGAGLGSDIGASMDRSNSLYYGGGYAPQRSYVPIMPPAGYYAPPPAYYAPSTTVIVPPASSVTSCQPYGYGGGYVCERGGGTWVMVR